ncbi:serine/threonine protein kinase [Actinomadura craniellae]|uniref:Serine/threonine protein kinase n=1 Tax=Actinomadura craniellae TaxID=2231787 RepID=A0A365H2G1_9ACTN|nr:serine/threonine-protein kinase [Actinomadura craniellae]RAY13287.1 serine/threonine protein kinase [Actinomadura craniellae]
MNDTWRVPGFTEVKVLGEGAQGRAVLVRQGESGRIAVLKYALAATEGAREAFRSESALLKSVQSPYVARWFGHYEHESTAAILMEAVDGAPLRDLLTRHAPLQPEAALAVLKGSLLGLAAAHAAGVVHRDYKPANVVVQADGLSKLIDFGVAALAGRAARSGTPAYMAPEQWRGEPAGPATDVYAATCVFFECVTGRKPYEAADQVALMARHITAPPPVEGVPEPLRPLLARGLAKHPADRPDGARTFVTDLEAAATAAYGVDWERRGVRALAAAAVALAAVFPLAALAAPAGGAVAAGSGTAGAAGAASGTAGAASGGGVLATAGGKVALGIAAASVVGATATGAVIVSGSGDEAPPPAQFVSASEPLLNTAYPVSGGRPDFTIEGVRYLQVTLRDKALQGRVNTALRAPLDRVIASSRTTLQQQTDYGRPSPGCRGAHLRGTMVRGVSGPRLVSVRYDLQLGLICASEYFGAAPVVTVDPETGKVITSADMFTPAGLGGLSGRLPARRPSQDLCNMLPATITPAHLRPAGGAVLPEVVIMPAADGLEVGPGTGFPCEGHLVKVPYSRIRDLLAPGFLALLPAAPTPGRPTPGRS